MKTLYLRIVVITLLIMIFSGFLAFLATNIYYQTVLKSKNDAKNTDIAKNIATLYEKSSPEDPAAYFKNVADLSFKLYVTNGGDEERFFGASFRDKSLDADAIEKVLDGHVYHGMANYPSKTFITGFFANELTNSIGVPVHIDGSTYALFMRPDLKKQFGEIHILLAVLLLSTIFLSMILVVISTRYIVRPVERLTRATQKIAGGRYDIALNVKRRDEIGTLARSFTVMSHSLKRLEEMRQEFVSNVSHEIQSPLTSIKGYAHTLLSQPLAQEQRREYLQIIESESGRLSRLSKQLLTLAFLDKESDVLDRRTFDLEKQLRTVVHQTAWLWQEKDLAIDFQTEPLNYRGDEKLLYQVWENLLTNSIKHTEPGGTIQIGLQPQDYGVLVSVQDNGAGISKEHLEKLFDRFYKADLSHGEDRSSSGLGLSIAKKIIDLHEGHIEVQSDVGEGTLFNVYLFSRFNE